MEQEPTNEKKAVCIELSPDFEKCTKCVEIKLKIRSSPHYNQTVLVTLAIVVFNISMLNIPNSESTVLASVLKANMLVSCFHHTIF